MNGVGGAWGWGVERAQEILATLRSLEFIPKAKGSSGRDLRGTGGRQLMSSDLHFQTSLLAACETDQGGGWGSKGRVLE